VSPKIGDFSQVSCASSRRREASPVQHPSFEKAPDSPWSRRALPPNASIDASIDAFPDGTPASPVHASSLASLHDAPTPDDVPGAAVQPVSSAFPAASLLHGRALQLKFRHDEAELSPCCSTDVLASDHQSLAANGRDDAYAIAATEAQHARASTLSAFSSGLGHKRNAPPKVDVRDDPLVSYGPAHGSPRQLPLFSRQ
jgi:hypothetical protein